MTIETNAQICNEINQAVGEDEDDAVDAWVPPGTKILTYDEMNKLIKDLLRASREPMNLYVVARIEELEEQLAEAQHKIERYEKTDGG